jgi:acetolactate synthase-1/2/3 large subunit
LEEKLKYSDYFMDVLVDLGYTHCFFVGGGNVMHLLESARTRMECVAVVNEVSAGIAAEYFNVANRLNNKRAFAMVTAGPGLTNIVTAIGGAWLESRELLVIGGQARTNLLSGGTVRQIGHQEIDGVGIVSPISKVAKQVTQPLNRSEISSFCNTSKSGRKGPVFLEICLDVSSMEYSPNDCLGDLENTLTAQNPQLNINQLNEAVRMIRTATRPIFLFGSGLSFATVLKWREKIEEIGIPVATTWNAADYWDYESTLYAGRPNTYGMRWSNVVIQQSDLVISIGARLGLQQTGFNWEEFVPVGEIIQVDIDQDELNKSNPEVKLSIHADASEFLERLIERVEGKEDRDWISYIQEIRAALPIAESANQIFNGYANPFTAVEKLGELCSSDDIVVPCSSGGSYTSMMQAFKQHQGQLLTNNKGLASMGYGLAGAIGSAIAFPEKRVILVEGDGGFMQNLSELGTVKARNLNLKMIIFVNKGYASIRVSQRAYFEGNYLGCDEETGLGFPEWTEMFHSYGIPTSTVSSSLDSEEVSELLNASGPAAILVDIHQDQPFYPKITSKIFPDGSMKSNPIHLMDPQLSYEESEKVLKFLPNSLR